MRPTSRTKELTSEQSHGFLPHCDILCCERLLRGLSVEKVRYFMVEGRGMWSFDMEGGLWSCSIEGGI